MPNFPWYKLKEWKVRREAFLEQHPWCAHCLVIGRKTRATVVDHLTPHQGDWELFWDEENWQPLCRSCHNSAKQKKEKSGVLKGCRADGMPVDPDHPWNR